MIFVTLGTQKFQMNRLLRLIDGYIDNKEIDDEIIAQTGCSDYKPKNYSYYKFIEKENFDGLVSNAEIIISHSGAGVIISAIKKNKPIIVLPRLKKYGEHVDDHQVEIGKAFEKAGYALCCDENSNLPEVIEKCRNYSFRKYEPQGEKMIEMIDDFLSRI